MCAAFRVVPVASDGSVSLIESDLRAGGVEFVKTVVVAASTLLNETAPVTRTS